jgi:hypothetical protein
MQHAGVVRVPQPALTAVCTVEPAQHVVERSVLHHEHDDVLDARRVG